MPNKESTGQRLLYHKPAGEWNEALPIGYGIRESAAGADSAE
jgi:hypothetical protein